MLSEVHHRRASQQSTCLGSPLWTVAHGRGLLAMLVFEGRMKVLETGWLAPPMSGTQIHQMRILGWPQAYLLLCRFSSLSRSDTLDSVWTKNRTGQFRECDKDSSNNGGSARLSILFRWDLRLCYVILVCFSAKRRQSYFCSCNIRSRCIIAGLLVIH